MTPLGEDATSAAVRLKLDPARTVAVDMLGGFKGRRTVMKTPLTTPETLGAAVAALSTAAPVTAINDSAGFVVQRLLAMIVNIGTRIAELRIAAACRHRYRGRARAQLPEGPAGARRHAWAAPRAGRARRHARGHARSEISRDRLAAPARAARRFIADAGLIAEFRWYRRVDLNHRPLVPQTSALTN